MNSHAFRSQIIKLIWAGDYKISEHALDALLEDELRRTDVSESVISSEILEYYPEFGKGPAILLYQKAGDGRIIHCLWGIPQGASSPAVLVTVYIPHPHKWDETLKVRKS